MVEQFAQQIAIPPDAEVDRQIAAAKDERVVVLRIVRVVGRAHHVTLHVADAVAVNAPHLHTGRRRVDIGSHSTAHVAVALYLEDNVARCSITQLRAVAPVLMAVPDEELVCCRLSDEMDGIAVPHTSVVKTGTVVVDGHGAVGNLIVSVTVNIGHAQVVVALSGIVAPLRVVGVECPAFFQVLSVPVPGRKNAARVVATAEDSAGVPPAEIAKGRKETVGAVGIVVAPVSYLAASRNVGLGAEGTPRKAVEHGDILRPGEDAA